MLSRAGFVGRMGPHARAIDPSAVAYFNALPTQPDSVQKQRINTLVRALKVAGVWDSLDMLQIYAVDTAANALVDLKTPSRVATAVNSPTFTQYRGYNGDGATSYINTSFAPASSAILALSNTHVGIWSLSSGQLNSLVEFGSNRESIAIRSLADNSGTRSNNTTNNNSTAVVTDGSGHFMTNRDNSSNYQVFRNASQYASHTQASSAVSDGNYFVGTRNDGLGGIVAPSTRQIAISHAGRALDATQRTAMYNAFQTYLTSVGAI